MVKSKSKSSYEENTIYCDLLIFAGLVYVYYIMNKQTEGITNMNCCGGIEPGVHYSETDRRPPDYVKRCFTSKRDDTGSTNYEWSGFPCTGKGSDDCCGGGGDCIASSKGGYCKRDDGHSYTYRRGDHDSESPYIKRSNDNIIDVNDVRDMEGYFYKRREETEDMTLSPEMKRFLERRGDNERFLEDAMVTNAVSKNKLRKEVQDKLKDQRENKQIVHWVTIIHLASLVVVAIIIRRLIINKIQGYIDSVFVEYLRFTGNAPAPTA